MIHPLTQLIRAGLKAIGVDWYEITCQTDDETGATGLLIDDFGRPVLLIAPAVVQLPLDPGGVTASAAAWRLYAPVGAHGEEPDWRPCGEETQAVGEIAAQVALHVIEARIREAIGAEEEALHARAMQAIPPYEFLREPACPRCRSSEEGICSECAHLSDPLYDAARERGGRR